MVDYGLRKEIEIGMATNGNVIAAIRIGCHGGNNPDN